MTAGDLCGKTVARIVIIERTPASQDQLSICIFSKKLTLG